jgi:hypothetical protein
MTASLTTYLRTVPAYRRPTVDDFLAGCARDIRDELLACGRVKVKDGRRVYAIDWEDFRVVVDEDGDWERLRADPMAVLDDYCERYAEARAEFLTEV